MSLIVSFVFSLGGVALALGAGLVWLWLRPGSRGARRWLVTVTVAFAAASTYAVPYTASRLLVAGYHPVDRAALAPGQTAIVLLASADYLVQNWDRESLPVADLSGAARMWETVRLARALPDAWVISSGGSGSSLPAPALTMRDAMIRAGVAASRILVEDRSANTRDEAVMVAAMLDPLHVEHVLLVTSDIHMRRSAAAFRAAGVAVTPAIARDPFLSAPWRKWLLPTTDAFELTTRVAHEVFGLAAYAARGWLRFS